MAQCEVWTRQKRCSVPMWQVSNSSWRTLSKFPKRYRSNFSGQMRQAWNKLSERSLTTRELVMNNYSINFGIDETLVYFIVVGSSGRKSGFLWKKSRATVIFYWSLASRSSSLTNRRRRKDKKDRTTCHLKRLQSRRQRGASSMAAPSRLFVVEKSTSIPVVSAFVSAFLNAPQAAGRVKG